MVNCDHRNQKPELKAAIQRRLQSGSFHDLDELLTKALAALPDDNAERPMGTPKKNFAQFLLESPLPGSGLKLERRKDYPLPIEL